MSYLKYEKGQDILLNFILYKRNVEMLENSNQPFLGR